MSQIIGGFNDDILIGTVLDDIIIGLTGNDSLKGKAGGDTLIGDEGNDTLGGADIFVIKPNSGFDVITDFQVGIDKLDLSAFNFPTVQDAGAASIFGGENDGIPGFTFSLPDFGVTVFIENRDLRLRAKDVIV